MRILALNALKHIAWEAPLLFPLIPIQLQDTLIIADKKCFPSRDSLFSSEANDLTCREPLEGESVSSFPRPVRVPERRTAFLEHPQVGS